MKNVATNAPAAPDIGCSRGSTENRPNTIAAALGSAAHDPRRPCGSVAAKPSARPIRRGRLPTGSSAAFGTGRLRHAPPWQDLGHGRTGARPGGRTRHRRTAGCVRCGRLHRGRGRGTDRIHGAGRAGAQRDGAGGTRLSRRPVGRGDLGPPFPAAGGSVGRRRGEGASAGCRRPLGSGRPRGRPGAGGRRRAAARRRLLRGLGPRLRHGRSDQTGGRRSRVGDRRRLYVPGGPDGAS